MRFVRLSFIPFDSVVACSSHRSWTISDHFLVCKRLFLWNYDLFSWVRTKRWKIHSPIVNTCQQHQRLSSKIHSTIVLHHHLHYIGSVWSQPKFIWPQPVTDLHTSQVKIHMCHMIEFFIVHARSKFNTFHEGIRYVETPLKYVCTWAMLACVNFCLRVFLFFLASFIPPFAKCNWKLHFSQSVWCHVLCCLTTSVQVKPLTTIVPLAHINFVINTNKSDSDYF